MVEDSGPVKEVDYTVPGTMLIDGDASLGMRARRRCCCVHTVCVWGLSQGPGWCRALPVELLGEIRDGTVCVRRARLSVLYF